MLPDVEWQPDYLPAYVDGSNQSAPGTGDEGSYYIRKSPEKMYAIPFFFYHFLSN
jgi:hypothetical protein